jgi:5-methylcytosine-specific restriction protein A
MIKHKEKRLYDEIRWRKLRIQILNEQPLCRICALVGRDVIADTVDHKIPHKGDYNLFYDRDNLQSLCKQCHDSTKKTQEQGGLFMGCDIHGNPIDRNHWWNKERE